MALLDRLEALARHRLPSDERRIHDSFRADIEAHWHPVAPAERRLERKSRLVHLATTVRGGGVTLAGVGVSGLVTLVGTVMLLVAPLPPTDWYDQPTPVWIETLLVVGILAMAVECARFPHEVRRVGFTATTVPLAVGALGAGLTMPVALAPDVALRAALLVAGVGACVSAVGALRQHDRTARVGLTVMGVGGLGVCVSDGVWVAIYAADHALWHATGCAFSAIGALLMANGLLFARPSLVRRP